MINYSKLKNSALWIICSTIYYTYLYINEQTKLNIPENRVIDCARYEIKIYLIFQRNNPVIAFTYNNYTRELKTH